MQNVYTLQEILDKILEMVRKKGWGDENGIQDPRHVVMAMSVEMGELMEHFSWLSDEDVRRLQRGEDPQELEKIGYEFADVVVYGLQLMNALGIDATDSIIKKIGVVDRRKYDGSDEE